MYWEEKVAESYINGNISWVREKIGKSLKKFFEVYLVIEYNNGKDEADRFLKMIYRGL